MGPRCGSCVNTGAVPGVEKFAGRLLAEATSKRCQKVRQEIRNQAGFGELLVIRGPKDVARSIDTLRRNSNLRWCNTKSTSFLFPFVSYFGSLHLAVQLPVNAFQIKMLNTNQKSHTA